jgi:hypothetical protein
MTKLNAAYSFLDKVSPMIRTFTRTGEDKSRDILPVEVQTLIPLSPAVNRQASGPDCRAPGATGKLMLTSGDKLSGGIHPLAGRRAEVSVTDAGSHPPLFSLPIGSRRHDRWKLSSISARGGHT